MRNRPLPSKWSQMISTTVYLTKEQVEKLDKLKQETKVPTAMRIRDAVDYHLKRLRK